MLHFGRSRSRRGLASALIGEIAAVIESMEAFEEVRKLESMEFGAKEHLDELAAFTLPKFSVYESNADRLDFFDAALQRKIAYFFTLPVALPGTSMRSHRRKMNRGNCANGTLLTRKRKSTAFRNWPTTCYVICESSYPKSR